MSKATKIRLVVAAFLITVGLLMFCAAMSVLGWDFRKMSTFEFETITYEIDKEFSDISINTNFDNIVFLPSQDDECKVVCEEFENMKHSVEVDDKTLVIKSLDERKWYEYIGINVQTPIITVYLPQNYYSLLFIKANAGFVEIPSDFKFENVDITSGTGYVQSNASASKKIKIKTKTGTVKINDVSAETLEITVTTGIVKVESVDCKGGLEINVTTGKTEMKDVVCDSFKSHGDTGDLSMKNVVAQEKFLIERTTGDVEFELCDAEELFITTDTGDVEGSLLREKIFFIETDTGKASFPKSNKGGKCEITTDTGDVKITIE